MTDDLVATISGLHHEIVREFMHVNDEIAEVKTLAEDTNGHVRTIELRHAFVKGALAVLAMLVASGGAWLLVLTRGGG